MQYRTKNVHGLSGCIIFHESLALQSVMTVTYLQHINLMGVCII